MSTSSIVKRGLVGVAAAAALLTGAMGALHTSWGRPLLARLGGCPVGKTSPAQVEAMRQRGLASLRGASMAPARPAFGFRLDETTRVEALAWTAAHGLRCEIKKRGGDAIFCRDVPPDAVGEPFASRPVDELALFFDPGDKLVQIETMRRRLPSAEAEAVFTGIVGKLSPVLGAPTEELGARTAAYFDQGGMQTSYVRYRFEDYVVIVNAMRFSEGVALRERYESATGAAARPRG
jgi:hypothetical protein